MQQTGVSVSTSALTGVWNFSILVRVAANMCVCVCVCVCTHTHTHCTGSTLMRVLGLTRDSWRVKRIRMEYISGYIYLYMCTKCTCIYSILVGRMKSLTNCFFSFNIFFLRKRKEKMPVIDWCWFYYFIRNSLVALLDTLFARIFLDLRFQCAVIFFFLDVCVCVCSVFVFDTTYFRSFWPGSCAWFLPLLLCQAVC